MAATGAIARPATPSTHSWIGTEALSDRLPLAAILVGATVIRSAWTLVAAPPPESDFLTFLQMARAIAHGSWWSDSYGWAYQGPGYPLLIAPLTLLGQGGLPAIYALNVALGVLSVALAYRLGSLLFGSRAGLTAAAITAAFPGLWSWTPLVAAENLSVPMLMGVAILLIAGTPRWRWPVLGVLTGLLVFVRPSMLFFVILVAIALVWMAPVGTKRRAVAGFAAGLALAIGLFGAANLAAGGPALPIGNSGWEPWLVHNERATGRWFAAKDREDYPFHGMEDTPAMTGIVRAAQVKLAAQFVLLNPTEVVPGIIERHTVAWQTDDAGLDWTIRRPTASPVAARLDPILDVLVDRYYVAVIALALLGTWVLAGRPAVVFALIIPVAYLMAPVVIAEGNARYHANALPFLAVLAGGLLASRSRPFGIVALVAVIAAWLAPPGVMTPAPLMIAFIAVIGVASLALDVTRHLRGWASGPSRRWVGLTLVVVIVGAELGLAAGLVAARQVVVDWSLTRPDGWTSYGSGPALPPGPVELRLSDVPSRFTKVSFPDSALLPYPPTARPGEPAGLIRRFPDLEVGAEYVVYLQVLLPAAGTPDDRLTVLLNGRVVWEAPDSATRQAGWRDVVVPWRADTPFASIQVERVARTPSAVPAIQVRSVHVYPKY